MNESTYASARNFLDPIYENVSSPDNRPFVTLTFAQSLDGKIGKQGHQILISGKESMAMTHRLRTLHDGILVGIGTVLVDNPQLNARYLPPEELPSLNQPQPIVLDPFLKIATDCKLIANYKNGTGKQLWLVVSNEGCKYDAEKMKELLNAGVKLIIIEQTENGRIPLSSLFERLKQEGIERLMVEGGSRIIQSCLKSKLWDQLIITTGPMFIGSSDGISAIITDDDNDLILPKLNNVQYQIMGKDIVMAATQ